MVKLISSGLAGMMAGRVPNEVVPVIACAKGWEANDTSLARIGAGPSYVVTVDVSMWLLVDNTVVDR